MGVIHLLAKKGGWKGVPPRSMNYSPEHKFLTLLRASIRRRCSKKRVKDMCS